MQMKSYTLDVLDCLFCIISLSCSAFFVACCSQGFLQPHHFHTLTICILGFSCFVGYVIVDTQEIIERAHFGDLDYVKHALTQFTNLAAIFVQILVILGPIDSNTGRIPVQIIRKIMIVMERLEALWRNHQLKKLI